MPYCTNCGAKIKLKEKFCPKCGAKPGTESLSSKVKVETNKSLGVNNKSVSSVSESDKELTGIGGWLFFPFLHLILYLVVFSYGVLNGGNVSLLLLGTMILALSALITGFMRKTIAIALFVLTYLGMLVVGILASLSGKTSPMDLATSMVPALIWMSYFALSKRVKNTFVN